MRRSGYQTGNAIRTMMHSMLKCGETMHSIPEMRRYEWFYRFCGQTDRFEFRSSASHTPPIIWGGLELWRQCADSFLTSWNIRQKRQKTATPSYPIGWLCHDTDEMHCHTGVYGLHFGNTIS